MNQTNQLQQVTPILKHYGVTPHFVESYGKIIKIYSDKGVFALKKISPTHGTDFIRHIQYLYQKGYNRIVPIYPTLDGRYAVIHQKGLYYLMPWLSNEVKEDRNERYQHLFRELARLHTLSVRDVPINKEEKEEHYENTIHEWEKENELIEGFLEQCENKWYMSPFELLFCLYYHDISQALRFSTNKFKEWYEKTKEDDKARVVLSHGKLSTEHFIYDDRGYGYFANFEDSRQGSPMHDLLPFLSRILNTYPKQCDECVDWLYTYFKFFPLKEEEMHLLLSYFAHPSFLLEVIEDYYKAPKKDERKYVRRLQREYWHLKNTEYIIMRIVEIERQKQLEKEAQAQAQDGAQN
jgi:spore coat protein YsxE